MRFTLPLGKDHDETTSGAFKEELAGISANSLLTLTLLCAYVDSTINL